MNVISRLRVALLAFTVLVICAGTTSCSHPKRIAQDDELKAVVNEQVARIAGGGQGHGFGCFGSADGSVGCACNDDAPEGDIWSCTGMERVCNALGTGQICNPTTNWCYCAVLGKR